jgi:hypothetical protein
MDFLTPIATFALPATVLLLLTLVGLRMRQRQSAARGAARDALDTVAAWPPEAARILSVDERQAYELLRRALPGFLVLAQVPLSRFIRVPLRHSYADWLQRVGALSADLLLCDAGSRVLAVIDVRAQQESDRARCRHERMARVLRASGIHVFHWREGALPSPAEVRTAMSRLVGVEALAVRPTASRPMPLSSPQAARTRADIEALLAQGDRASETSLEPGMDPVPSAFFEELEPAAARR